MKKVAGLYLLHGGFGVKMVKARNIYIYIYMAAYISEIYKLIYTYVT